MAAKARQRIVSAITQRTFEQALASLEQMCLEIEEGQFAHGKEDTDRLFWQQKLKNIVKSVSLALAEYRGPRVFHQHYRHGDGDTLTPVLESSRVNLLRTCIRALAECEGMHGMKGSKLLEERALLERALKETLAVA